MSFVLEIVEGVGAGRRLPLETSAELGREAALRIDDPLVSRRQARFTVAAQGVVVEDLGSRNGTFVNGQPLHGPTALHPGDAVQVGTTVMKLRTGADADSGETAIVAVPPALAAAVPGPPRVAATADASTERINTMLDARVKHQASTAPIAIFVLVVLVALVVLVLRLH